MQYNWIKPLPEKSNKISPTALMDFEQCPKLLAFKRDPAAKGWQRRNTRMALGLAAHALTAEVGRGISVPPSELRIWLEQRWDELVLEQWERLRRDWIGRQVPEPKMWRGYVATRTRLLRRLESITKVVPQNKSALGKIEELSLPWVELELTDEDSGLFGTPDRVEVLNHVLRVVDLKSGSHQGSMKDSQRKQLLVYAHLVSIRLGRLPEQIVVQNARGKEYVEAVDPAEVASVVSGAKRAIWEFNTMLNDGHVTARPNEDSCAYCPFRVVCKDYWQTRTDDWGHLAAIGVVEHLDSGTVVLRPSSGFHAGVERVILETGIAPQIGAALAVTDLDRAGHETGRMRWNSPLRITESLF
jgi:CRISPR/Cas system-associated exonuclease Cas4 (RecB family)